MIEPRIGNCPPIGNIISHLGSDMPMYRIWMNAWILPFNPSSIIV